MASNHGRATVVVTALLLALALAAGNLFVLARWLVESGGPIADAVQQAYAAKPNAFLFLAISPIAAGVLIALVAGLTGGTAKPAAVEPAEEAAVTSLPHASALRLLALLQQEGRLIDFLEEDIDQYSDQQVGNAVRAIHAGCRKALRERMRIERIRSEDDGATLSVDPGFDPAEVRLTGNVHGQPPFQGTLQHGGWRAADVKLPEAGGADAAILAPAEVEIA